MLPRGAAAGSGRARCRATLDAVIRPVPGSVLQPASRSASPDRAGMRHPGCRCPSGNAGRPSRSVRRSRAAAAGAPDSGVDPSTVDRAGRTVVPASVSCARPEGRAARRRRRSPVAAHAGLRPPPARPDERASSPSPVPARSQARWPPSRPARPCRHAGPPARIEGFDPAAVGQVPESGGTSRSSARRASSGRGNLPSPARRRRRSGCARRGHGLSWPIRSVKPRSRCQRCNRAAIRPPPRPAAHRTLSPRAPEELREPALRLEVPPDHHRVIGLERLGDPIDQRPREPQRHPTSRTAERARYVTTLQTIPVCSVAVALVDVLDDLLAPRRREVDVDVRVGRPALVDEPLEQQLVADRVDPGDPQHVGDDRIARAPPPLGRDPTVPANSIRSQQIRKNSARPVRSITSSSWASWRTTAGVRGW